MLTGFNNVPGLKPRGKKAVGRILGGLKTNHCGRSRAVKSFQIEEKVGLSGPEIRAIISYLRKGDPHEGRDPEPICSSSDGYFYAENEDELNETISHIAERIRALEVVKSGLYRSLQIMAGNARANRQTTLVE